MKATLTVKKQVLKNRLRAQIDHIQTTYDNSSQIKDMRELREKLANGESLEQFTERTLAWHRKIVDGLVEGTITLTRTGTLHGGPAKPKRNKFMSQWDGSWTIESCDKQLKKYEEHLASALKPLQTSIEILDMSDGDDVLIDAADYHAMLSAEISIRYW